MNTINDGGPAFPRAAGDYGGTKHGNGPQTGMTLRDYFAAKAMQGILVLADHTVESMTLRNYADWSYEMADAMLKARSQDA